jgi:hypothetical protein
LQRLEAILDAGADARVQDEGFPVNVVIADVGLEESHVLGAVLRDAVVRKDPDFHPASMSTQRR